MEPDTFRVFYDNGDAHIVVDIKTGEILERISPDEIHSTDLDSLRPIDVAHLRRVYCEIPDVIHHRFVTHR
jgi:hypothetical protein